MSNRENVRLCEAIAITLAEIRRLRDRMKVDQEEIERSAPRTDSLLAEIMARAQC